MFCFDLFKIKFTEGKKILIEDGIDGGNAEEFALVIVVILFL